MSKLTFIAIAAFALLGCGGGAFTAVDAPAAVDSGALGETAVDHVVVIDSGTDRATEPDAPEEELEAGIDEGGSSSSSSSGGGSSSGGSSSGSSSDGDSSGGSDSGSACVLQTSCAVLCPYGPCCINSSTCGCSNVTRTACLPL
jgi:hypothetical protein